MAGLPRGVVASVVRRPHSPEASGSSNSSQAGAGHRLLGHGVLSYAASPPPAPLDSGRGHGPHLWVGEASEDLQSCFELSALSWLPQLGPDLNGLWSGSAEHVVLYLVSLRPWDGDPSYRSRVPLWGQASSSRRCVSPVVLVHAVPQPHAHIRHANVC